MIEGRAAGAAVTAAGAAVSAAKGTPTVWHLLGYPFEAMGMIAALFACGCARFWSANQLAKRKAFFWTADIPVSAITFAATMAAVIAMRPEPLVALGLGAGVGVIGEGVFSRAQRLVERFDIFGGGEAAPPISVPVNQVPPEMTDLTRKLDEEPKA